MLGPAFCGPKQAYLEGNWSPGHEPVKRNPWRRRIGDLLLISGGLIILSVVLFWIQSILGAHQIYEWRYLEASSNQRLPNPPLPPTPTPRAVAVAIPQATPVVTEETLVQVSPTPQEIGVQQPQPTQVETDVSQPVSPSSPESQVTQVASTQMLMGLAFPIVMRNEVSTPTPIPDTGRVVRLVIPKIRVDRAVVRVGLTRDAQGRLQWDTDRLFATQNRLDLVGQLDNSLNPGQGGNVVLVGHNYDNGVFVWEGVFINLKNIQAGDQLIIYTEGGAEYHYIVEQIKKVPWQAHNDNEMQKHMRYIGPSEAERLTLMTCSGANIWPWPARLYVIAAPVAPAAQ